MIEGQIDERPVFQHGEVGKRLRSQTLHLRKGTVELIENHLDGPGGIAILSVEADLE